MMIDLFGGNNLEELKIDSVNISDGDDRIMSYPKEILNFENRTSKLFKLNKLHHSIMLPSIYSICDNLLIKRLIHSYIEQNVDIKSHSDIMFLENDGNIGVDEIRKITGDSGNDRRGLNMPLIRSIKFSYPKKLSEQKEIISKLGNLRAETKKLEAIYQKKINDLEELKKSVLQKAFSGELTSTSSVTKEIAVKV